MRRAIPVLLALLWVMPAKAETGVVHYACNGIIQSENIFVAGSVVSQSRHYDILVNFDHHFVKRDQELAAGCLTRQIEMCSCDLGEELISCRSLGLNPRSGQEVAAEFSIDRSNGRMRFTGRRTDPESGQLIESQGQLSCQITAK